MKLSGALQYLSSQGSGIGSRCTRNGSSTPSVVAFSNRSRNPSLFEVKDISPPPESLGLHSFPPNTTNGDVITVNGQSYVVKSTVIRYKLQRGRYRPCHKRLDVLGTSRYIYNLYLTNIYSNSPMK
ncbi:hypothetical protein M9434_003372 [Picochlorum sp. BPE23]|nr:hypothetical protein M9434_003372 [Picochlorum sp. BPE23]KAI8105413.1 hypothetical protein M9435_000579 [Picochlorum sp. BPE23]